MRANPVRRAVQLTREEVVRRGTARLAELEAAALLQARFAAARVLCDNLAAEEHRGSRR